MKGSCWLVYVCPNIFIVLATVLIVLLFFTNHIVWLHAHFSCFFTRRKVINGILVTYSSVRPSVFHPDRYGTYMFYRQIIEVCLTTHKQKVDTDKKASKCVDLFTRFAFFLLQWLLIRFLTEQPTSRFYRDIVLYQRDGLKIRLQYSCKFMDLAIYRQPFRLAWMDSAFVCIIVKILSP